MATVEDTTNPTEAATPAPNIIHDPPSQPASPLPKRTKVLDPAPPLTSVAAILNDSGTSTPTPAAMSAPPPPAPVLESAPPPLQVKKLSDKARTPTRGSAFAAGYDIYSAEQAVVPARGKALIATDISIAVPFGTYGRVAPRSGLAAKHSIDVGAGVIDADYRGPLKILLFNLSDVDFNVTEGERVAQLVLERIYTPEVVVVDTLEETVRGAGGFGSTGGFAGLATVA